MRWLALVIFLVAGCLPFSSEFVLHGNVPPPSQRDAFESAVYQAVGGQFSNGNEWKLEPNGHVFSAMVEEIGKAQHSVDIVSYIWHSGEPSERLITALSKRDKGVRCRVVTDPLGSPDFVDKVKPRLELAGCETHMFRPLGKHFDVERDHRKIAVIDGRIGLVGGFGIRQEWARRSGSADPEWRDINVRIAGPVVQELQRAFAQDWMLAGGAILPTSEFPTLPDDKGVRAAFIMSSFGLVTNAERLTTLSILSARKRLWIWNAYFVPDTKLRDLLIRKKREGVDVRIIAPGDKNDVFASKIGQRHSYGPLRAGGVRIFEFQPTMMHAKTMIIDDDVAIIGSINLSALSLTRLQEDALILEDPAVVQALEHEWSSDIDKTREIP